MLVGRVVALLLARLVTATAHDVPYVSGACEQSVQLVKRAPLRVAIATLWIDEPADDGRRLLPRAFRRAALARISAFLCAVRAATEMPVLVGTSNADVEAQRRICDPARRVGVLNLTAVDTKAVFRPVYAVDEASTRKMWFNLTTNQAPQARTDGWKTRYKFILFNCTRWADQFVYLDLDVVLLADPHRVAKRWERFPLVSAFECAHRGYVGMHGSVIVFRTDATVSRALFEKSLTHDYLVYTNGDQDIMDAYWCPSISALPDTRRYAGCEIKARLDTSFALTYAGPAAPVFLSDPTMTGPAGVPHIHDAYAKRETCADYAVEIGVSRAPCQCLRSSAPSVAARRRLDAAFGYCLPFVREAYPGLTKPAYFAEERHVLKLGRSRLRVAEARVVLLEVPQRLADAVRARRAQRARVEVALARVHPRRQRGRERPVVRGERRRGEHAREVRFQRFQVQHVVDLLAGEELEEEELGERVVPEAPLLGPVQRQAVALGAQEVDEALELVGLGERRVEGPVVRAAVAHRAVAGEEAREGLADDREAFADVEARVALVRRGLLPEPGLDRRRPGLGNL